MEKSYSPEGFESRLYEFWEKNGCFDSNDKSDKPAFSMALPPPNITGVLHNGHALVLTIEDTLTRWKRMQGFNTLWLPGTDHAGIATQMVVERALSKEGKTRHDLGREKFVERVWEWREKHGAAILNQMKKLGASLDWKRLQFTMDPHLCETVKEVFVRLYEEGLIYRGSRLINWCTRCQTALSDLEVVPKETKGGFWHIRYQLKDGSGELVIATTRPETMLGDTAVAVHPDDERYQSFIGKKVTLPLTGREIPVIGDAYVDREFGSGALKVTPGHDFNDFDLGQRHKLPLINIFDKKGRLNAEAGAYAGLKITEAREKIVQELEAQGLIVKKEEHTRPVGVCQRCETVLEPMMSDQWFMKMQSMAEKAIAAVKKGEGLTLEEVDLRDDAVKILPESWLSTYYHWMENIRDWCVSRQLWWGHQIPAWHCLDCKKISVSRDDLKNCVQCKSSNIKQDEDVLDTWFSSALWPFSTLGWPKDTEALRTFYPTTIMETGFDILFFWVARMMMMGMHFNEGKVPFKRVYLHAMVRDEKGQKMSKTKGNVIDPLDIVRDYGADAFRFTLAAMAGQGRDVKLSLDRIEGYKGFCNKLWNASRYVMMRLGHVQAEGTQAYPKVDFQKLTGSAKLEDWIIKNHQDFHPINQWILARLQKAVKTANSGLEEFRLNESALELYTMIWNEYCDWYIEFSKELLTSPQLVAQTQVCLAYVLEQLLKLAHPFIPFVTEEIYQNVNKSWNGNAERILMVEKYPEPLKLALDEQVLSRVEGVQEMIERLRTFRGENGISPKARPKAYFKWTAAQGSKNEIEWQLPFIKTVAGLEELSPVEPSLLQSGKALAEVICKSATFYIPLAGLVDVEGELKRLDKEKKEVLNDIEFVKNKLGKETFIAKAPKELVDKEREKLKFFETKLSELEKTEQKLRSMG